MMYFLIKIKNLINFSAAKIHMEPNLELWMLNLKKIPNVFQNDRFFSPNYAKNLEWIFLRNDECEESINFYVKNSLFSTTCTENDSIYKTNFSWN